MKTDDKVTPKIITKDPMIKLSAAKKISPNKDKDKTPVKVDILEEVAMPSWSDNSQTEIITPKEVANTSDSQDMKLFYDETAETMPNTEDVAAKNDVEMKDEEVNKDGDVEMKDEDVELKKSAFLQSAKVIDVKQPAPVTAAPSPKTPRRVSFVTLSSPKNSKKKL